MPNRLDIELTSVREDGSWTWRVAGARQPKGVAPRDVIPAGSKTGDVLTVDAEIDIEGITILSVLPRRVAKDRKGRQADGAERILVIGSRAVEAAGVTTTLVPSKGRAGGPRRTVPGPPTPGGGATRQARPATERPGRGTHRERPPRGTEGESHRLARTPRAGERRTTRPAARPSPPSVRRQALLDSLSAEQRAVADRLVSGGLPAVRRAIDDQNAAARSAGHPEVPAEPILAMAESLLPRLKTASWCDRAEAALQSAEPVALGVLRSLVSTAEEAGRDEPGRSLLEKLREEVHTRVAASRSRWVDQITSKLDAGETVRALTISSSPPDPGATLPAAVATRLAEAAGNRLSPETPAPSWTEVLEAAANSPVRIAVRPSGLPPAPPVELLEKARRLSGRIPALAKLLGLAIPPPPSPRPTPTRRHA